MCVGGRVFPWLLLLLYRDQGISYYTHTHSAQLIVICCWPCVFVVGGIRPQFRPLCYTKDVVLRVPRSRNYTKGNKQTKSTLLSSSSFSSSFIGFQSQPHQNSFEFDRFWSSLFSHFSGSTIGAKTKPRKQNFRHVSRRGAPGPCLVSCFGVVTHN